MTWGPRGSGGRSHYKFDSKIIPKAQYYYSGHFGLLTFRIHFRKPKTHIFVVFELVVPSTGPKTNYFDFWRHQVIPNNSRNSSIRFHKYHFWKSQNLGNHLFESFRTYRARQIMKTRFSFMGVSNMGSRSSREHFVFLKILRSISLKNMTLERLNIFFKLYDYSINWAGN